MIEVIPFASLGRFDNEWLAARYGLEGELISGWGAARLVSAGPARKHMSPRRILISG